jgi:hypothetical protein
MWTETDAISSKNAQADVFDEALRLFFERNAKYKDLWKQYEADDHALHIKSKAMRVVQSVTTGGTPNEICEDAYDLINYAAFLIRTVAPEVSRGDHD